MKIARVSQNYLQGAVALASALLGACSTLSGSFSMTVIPNSGDGSAVLDCRQTSSGRCFAVIMSPTEAQPRMVSVAVKSKLTVESVPAGSTYCVGTTENISWASCRKSVLTTSPADHSHAFFDGTL